MELNVEAEEISPDLLKNTPSNIRRLAHEIEQCQGRQKYLAHTRSPSDGGDVRWYFCKVPLAENELAASVPQTEIVGKGDYFRFGMRDSLAIEATFLQREEELLSSWWKDYAECTAGPSGTGTVPKSTLKTKEIFEKTPESRLLYATEEERVGVPVKGGLYEVDLLRRHCFPVYWNGENRRVLRGHWFARKVDWLPLREDVSEQLEHAYRTQVWHRRTFQQSGLFAARVDLQGSISGLHALFTGEDDTWEAWLSVDSSGFSGIVRIGRNGIKLRRGYAPSQSNKPTQDELRQQKEEEIDDYCSQVPVKHVVFMVHGIGQRLEKSNLVDDVGDFRQVTANVAERHLTYHQLGTQRVLYIPCQWRKGLTFSGEVAVGKITLDGVRGLRTMLGATVHDILYYMSPIYCQEIIDSVSNQLNKLYLKFLRRNPGYDGKVSIYGHSLGSVLSYDILCHQDTLLSSFPMEWLYKEQKGSEEPSSSGNNLTPSSNPITNLRDETSENVQSENAVYPVDCVDLFEDLFEDPVEGTLNPLGPPATSESDASSTIDGSFQQTDLLPLDGSRNETYQNSNHKGFHKDDTSNDPDSKAESVLYDGGGDVQNIVDYTKAETSIRYDRDITDDDNTAETIKLLKEEVNLLKSKIKQYEDQCADKAVSLNTKKSMVAVSKSDPERTQSAPKDALKSYTPQIRYSKLEFKVDTFFAVGSPLGVFLSLRNIRIGIGKGKEYWKEEIINEEMPACRQMFNIFHPFDPVAYRIEPLVCKEFILKRPVIIPYHKSGKRMHIGFREFKEGLALHARATMNHLKAVRDKVLTICESGSRGGRDEDSDHAEEKEERSYGFVMMDRLTGSEDGRVDHVLQDRTFNHPYISAIGAHTNYWRDPDTALFMLQHLYRDVPEQPPLSPPGEEVESSPEGENGGSKGWCDPRQVGDEELPLTFANRIFLKHFSHEVKKLSDKR